MEARGSRGARGPSARDSDERDDGSSDGGARRVCRGQDVGDGVWPVVAALLPRAAQLQVRAGLVWRRRVILSRSYPGPDRVTRASARRAARGQVTSGGDILVVSGAGDKGASRMTLSGGKGLGPDGAQRLADVLQKAPPAMLAVLDLRCLVKQMRRKALLILIDS